MPVNDQKIERYRLGRLKLSTIDNETKNILKNTIK